uniref:Pentatricopeptide repeat-containing protein n=1 Tax=Cannabis sativa TaxID=3483 RepID=A0A803PWK4_CANSA
MSQQGGVEEIHAWRNHLLNFNSKSQCFGYAQKLFDESTQPGLVSWSALISRYVQNGLSAEALLAFYDMHSFGIKSNEFTFPSVLKACSITKDLNLGKQVHGVGFVTGFESDVFVANTLVCMYAKCGEFGDSRRLFDEIVVRDVVSWNALFFSYMQHDYCREAVKLFMEMIESGIRPNEFTLSTISAFNEIAQPDIVSWNAIIAGCVHHEDHKWALRLIMDMKRLGLRLNMFTLSSALKACAGLGLKELGRQLHSSLVKMDTKSDVFVDVGLIDMYSKCKMMKDAKMVHSLMPKKNLIAWNAIITGHSQNGEDFEALWLFVEVFKQKIGFNRVTLSTVLKSTATLQAIKVCQQIHAISMKTGYQSDIYVINSFLDTYAKCSQVKDAARIFEECKVGDLVAFTSMIAAYAQYGQDKLYSLDTN